MTVLSGMAKAAAGATLEWDANTEPDVRGYKLYYGLASGQYSDTTDAGNATSTFVPTLVSGFTYYFVVTAYNSSGLESPPSNEVSFTVPWPEELQLTYLPRAATPPKPVTTLECTPAAGLPGAGFAFTVTAAEQSAITVYASEDLQSWEILGSVSNPTGRLMIRDLSSTRRAKRFYRLSSMSLAPVED